MKECHMVAVKSAEPVLMQIKIKSLLVIAGLCLTLLIPFSSVAQDNTLPFKPGEKIDYDIYYHWGPIWKKAGTAYLKADQASYKNQAAYKLMLAGKTMNFADKILKVRDTLDAYITTDIVPLYYNKITNEGNYWSKDIMHYNYDANGTRADINVYKKKGLPRDTTLQIGGPGFDMLTVFYYLRTVDFKNSNLYNTMAIPIFSGRKVIIMNVKYMGKGGVVLRNKKEYECYRLYLTFLNDKTFKDQDDPIEVWLSSDDKQLPVKVKGKLPIGSLEAEIAR